MGNPTALELYALEPDGLLSLRVSIRTIWYTTDAMTTDHNTSERVRGIVRTAEGHLLLIKRIRPGVAPYWVFPGGGVEPTDESREGALRREIREELGCDAIVDKLVFVLTREASDSAQQSRELFYLAQVGRYDASLRSGPEFLSASSGEYIYDNFELNDQELAARDIKPEELKEWLRAHWHHLDSMPDQSEVW